jgi:hypothetical protein
MEVTKRALLIGTGAGVAMGLSLSAKAASVTETPLIPIQTGPQVHIIRYRQSMVSYDDYTSDGVMTEDAIAKYYTTIVPTRSQTLISILKYTANEGVLVDSLIEAEDRIIARATEVAEPWDVLPWGLRRQAAYLTCSNRRGWPTGVMMHPSMAARLTYQDWTSQENGTQVGRWLRVGSLYKLGMVYLANHMPKDQAVIFYHNTTIDAGCVLLDHRNAGKNLSLITMERTRLYPTGIQDYVRRIRFT